MKEDMRTWRVSLEITDHDMQLSHCLLSVEWVSLHLHGGHLTFQQGSIGYCLMNAVPAGSMHIVTRSQDPQYVPC